jgi:hypothetical protein
MSSLGERLQAKALLLGERVTREMYQDPFWTARFGSRGRELADKDNQFHLSHLLQALDAADVGVFETYTRELQTLLVSRGMCSRHIVENFERLARAIQDEVSEPEAALEVLRAGRQALTYAGGPARELQRLADPLADRTLEVLSSRQPSWFSLAATRPSMAAFASVAQAEQARFKRDVLDHIAYLADAMHAERAELFTDHMLWMQQFSTGRQAPANRLTETLIALDECLGLTLPAGGAAPNGAGEATANTGDGARVGRSSVRPSANDVSAPPVPRASLRPAPLRPSLSPQPEAPVPLPVSAELAAASRQLIELALQRLAFPDAASAKPYGEQPAPERTRR